MHVGVSFSNLTTKKLIILVDILYLLNFCLLQCILVSHVVNVWEVWRPKTHIIVMDKSDMDTCNAGFDRIVKYNFGVENNLSTAHCLFLKNYKFK